MTLDKSEVHHVRYRGPLTMEWDPIVAMWRVAGPAGFVVEWLADGMVASRLEVLPEEEASHETQTLPAEHAEQGGL